MRPRAKKKSSYLNSRPPTRPPQARNDQATPDTSYPEPDALTAPTVKLGTFNVMAYSEHKILEFATSDVNEVAQLLTAWPVVWVNLEDHCNKAALKFFSDHLGLHALALEDVANGEQRPKVETYDDHQFIVVRMLHNDAGVLETEQLAMFLGKKFVITFQGNHPGDCLEPLRARLRAGRGQVRAASADHLAYEILDAVIDHYFPITHWMDERLQLLEDEIVTSVPKTAPERVLSAKHDVLLLKRIIGPTRDLVMVLQRNDLQLFRKETLPYLRDCYDHANRLLDTIDSQREVTSTLMDLYLSMAADRTNSVMRFLTIISTIFIPLTFVAGVYGMNFDPSVSPFNMPELRWYYGYPFSLVVMLVVALLLTSFLYLNGWLERPKR